ncbi:hypothetical protein HYW74_05005 [Candidatus Pacearchaeota archaeon]|nr:hypothetical protein [Candidatus Pacearchaeota archaeon]
MSNLEFPILSKGLSLDDFCLKIADEIQWCLARKLSHDPIPNLHNLNGKYYGIIIYNCNNHRFIEKVSSKLRSAMEKRDVFLPIILLPDNKEAPKVVYGIYYPFDLQWFVDNKFVKYED